MFWGCRGKFREKCCCVLLKLNRESPSLSTLSALEQIILRIPMLWQDFLISSTHLRVVHGSLPSSKKKELQGSNEGMTDYGITSEGARTWISDLTDRSTSVHWVDVQQNIHEFASADSPYLTKGSSTSMGQGEQRTTLCNVILFPMNGLEISVQARNSWHPILTQGQWANRLSRSRSTLIIR